MLVTTSVQLSVAVANPVFVVAVLASQLMVTLLGQLITGLVVSCMIMVCAHALELVQESTAVQVLVNI
jgi:hypothetical protein